MHSNLINLFDDNNRNQKKRVYNALLLEPMTMLEVSSYTNVRRANICRYVAEMEDNGLVCLVGKRKCTISGHPFVGIYTADKSLFLGNNQISMGF